MRRRAQCPPSRPLAGLTRAGQPAGIFGSRIEERQDEGISRPGQSSTMTEQERWQRLRHVVAALSDSDPATWPSRLTKQEFEAPGLTPRGLARREPWRRRGACRPQRISLPHGLAPSLGDQLAPARPQAPAFAVLSGVGASNSMASRYHLYSCSRACKMTDVQGQGPRRP